MKKNYVVMVAVLGVFAGLASVFWFVFPVRTGGLLADGSAMALRAWQGMFGGAGDEEIAPDGGGVATDTGLTDSAGTLDGDDGAVFSENVPPVAPSTPSIPSTSKKSSAAKKVSKENDPPAAVDGAADTSVSPPTVSVVATPLPSALASAPAPVPACVVNASASGSSKIILNEIAWMGSVPATGETASAASAREWIELKNNSSDTAALAGWSLVDRSGAVKIVFDAGDAIAPHGYFLLARGTGTVSTAGAAMVDKNYSGGLSNAGDVLELFDPACNASDVLDASSGWPAGNNATKQTLERDLNGIGWHTSLASGGTPGTANSDPAPAIADQNNIVVDPAAPIVLPPIVSSPATASSSSASSSAATSSDEVASSTTAVSSTLTTSTTHIMIAEVAIAGASSTNDLVKLFNPGTAPIDMSGWKLHKRSSTGTESSLRALPDGSVIAGTAYFTWANSGGGFGDGIGANVTSSETLAADNSVALLDASGTVIDAVAWGTGTNQYIEGAAYPTNPAAGQVLVRTMVGGVPVDTDNNANDFTLQPE